MIFKYVTDGFRSLVIDEVEDAELTGYALQENPPRSESPGQSMWKMHVWSKLGGGQTDNYGPPSDVIRTERPLRSILPDSQSHVFDNGPVAGYLWAISLRSGHKLRLFCNHSDNSSGRDGNAYGVFLMNDEGKTISRDVRNVNESTGERLARSIAV